jgi:hypothetical protein
MPSDEVGRVKNIAAIVLSVCATSRKHPNVADQLLANELYSLVFSHSTTVSNVIRELPVDMRDENEGIAARVKIVRERFHILIRRGDVFGCDSITVKICTQVPAIL